jgi:hypothetical protein
MHYASEQLRSLYGLGGLGDLTFATMTQRTIAMPLPSAAQMMTQTALQNMITASGDPDPTNPQQESDQTAGVCDCAISEAARVFSLPANMLPQLNQACAADPASFVVQLQQQAATQGVRLDVANCGRGGALAQPWYKEPKNLAIGAAGVGALAILWMAFR